MINLDFGVCGLVENSIVVSVRQRLMNSLYFGWGVRFLITAAILIGGIDILSVHSNYWPNNKGQIEALGILKWFIGSLVLAIPVAAIFLGIEYLGRKLIKAGFSKNIVLLDMCAAANCSFLFSFWILPLLI